MVREGGGSPCVAAHSRSCQRGAQLGAVLSEEPAKEEAQPHLKKGEGVAAADDLTETERPMNGERRMHDC